MPYKRILTIQDISCFGQCSLTVALPILSACGMETCILPSAILSTHTAGFSDYVVHDFTDNMGNIVKHWQKENITFDVFYTGYLGSIKQIESVKDVIKKLGNDGSIAIIDPAMADNGKLYPAFDMEYAKEMRKLCCGADMILPNVTEACFLSDTDYKEKYDEEYILSLLRKLESLGVKTIILTGVSYKSDKTGVVVYKDEKMNYYEHIKIAEGCHGTGDIYSSAFVGAYISGKDVYDSARIAANYTVRCIENTQDDKKHWYGAKFETAIPYLLSEIHK